MSNYKCAKCEADTRLMYKYDDGTGVLVEHPVCMNCLINEIECNIRKYYHDKAKDPDFKKKDRDIKLYTIMEPFAAIAVNLEFCDIRIMRIMPHAEAGVNVAVIIRSISNNQYHCYTYNVFTLQALNRKVKQALEAEFAKSRYHEDYGLSK